MSSLMLHDVHAERQIEDAYHSASSSGSLSRILASVSSLSRDIVRTTSKASGLLGKGNNLTFSRKTSQALVECPERLHQIQLQISASETLWPGSRATHICSVCGTDAM